MYIYILIISLLSLASLLIGSSKSKLSKVLIFLPILFLLVFNSGNKDYEVYKYLYNTDDSLGMANFGFDYLIYFLKFLGLEHYNWLLAVLSLLIFFTFFRYSKLLKGIHFLSLLYFIFPFFLDVIQIRNTFMLFFVLNAIYDLINKRYTLCFLFLFLGYSFHTFAIIYIMFILVISPIIKSSIYKHYLHFNNITNYKLFIGLSIVSVFNIIFGKKILQYVITVTPIDSIRHKLPLYITDQLNLDSLIVWGGILFLDLIVASYLLNIIVKNKSELNTKTLFTLYSVLISGIVFIGFLTYLHEFNRLFRFLFIIKYIFFIYMERYLSSETIILLRGYLIFNAIFLGVVYFVRGIKYDEIIMQNFLL